MKATLALLLSLCLVLVDVSFGDDNGNIDTAVTPKAEDATNGKKCERLVPKLTDFNCMYWCKGIEGGYDYEDDGTPCRFYVLKGKCKNGRCVTERSRISVRSVEPTEESPEPTEETPVPAEGTFDRVV